MTPKIKSLIEFNSRLDAILFADETPEEQKKSPIFQEHVKKREAGIDGQAKVYAANGMQYAAARERANDEYWAKVNSLALKRLRDGRNA